jgi:hypothetical protein
MAQTQPVLDQDGNPVKRKRKRTISVRRFKVNSDGTRTLVSVVSPQRPKSAVRKNEDIKKVVSKDLSGFLNDFPISRNHKRDGARTSQDFEEIKSQSNADQKGDFADAAKDSKDYVV